MELKNYSIVLSLILLTSTLSGCSLFAREPEKQIVTETKIIKPTIAVAERPKGLNLSDIRFYVVTEDNFSEFKERFIKENGDYVFYAIAVRDYENLALNMAEIKRFILQQKEVIIYYEKAVTENSNDINNSSGTTGTTTE
jgi:hypothetical protein